MQAYELKAHLDHLTLTEENNRMSWIGSSEQWGKVNEDINNHEWAKALTQERIEEIWSNLMIHDCRYFPATCPECWDLQQELKHLQND